MKDCLRLIVYISLKKSFIQKKQIKKRPNYLGVLFLHCFRDSF